MNEYDKKARDFAEKVGAKLVVLGREYRKYFYDDKDKRYVFKLRLSKGRKSYTFDFGQSLAAGSNKPTLYDVFSCLEKYDPGTFEDFCWMFGYDEYSRRAERTWKAVVKEWNAVERLFGDCLDELREIS